LPPPALRAAVSRALIRQLQIVYNIEVFTMLSLRGIITLLILIALFALAVVWISKNGGWKGEGCGGNCASCHERCESASKKPAAKKDEQK
jgi:hypothetical protein